jgi:fibro-slime domain-containing protein
LSIIGCGGESADGRSGFRVEGTEAGDCEDNADNDADGLFDCDDPGCAGSSVCAAEVDGGIGGIGGNAGTGGMGGMAGQGGMTGEGGTAGSGGMTGEGGTAGSGGMTGEGGTAGSGGMTGEGGTAGSGGAAGAGGSVGGASGNGGTGGVMPLDCGDSMRDAVEACDDGNNNNNDGCAADCMMIESGYRCLTVGALCVEIVCGDSRIDPPETCDDGNAAAADGCSTTCEREDGWACPLPGVACVATECGDGIVAGFEQCDDGNAGTEGCSADCQIEDGFKCDTPGEACEPTSCGDGTREGTEQCDDGNLTPFDGCGVDCKNEPNCSGGACQAVCGDAVILPGTNEDCDDGNTNDGDGCSSTCQLEDGFECVLSPVPLPDELSIPVIYRDFRSYDNSSSDPFSPDFNNPTDGNGTIAFDITEDFLDGEGRPELSGENPYVSGPNEGPPHTAESFAQWYRTSPTLDPQGNLEIVGELVLGSAGNNVYQFSSTSFFPLDDALLAPLAWPSEPTYGEMLFSNHNFGFTTEAHYFFVYQGDEVLSFSGDDDLWVFVDGFLCLDVGGLHPSQSDVMSFADPTSANSSKQDGIVAACKARLTPGDVYEVAIFHAERHTNASNFSLTLDGFVTERSTCDYTCGDGIATRFEFCDDGTGQNNGEYGHCLADCSALGPHCGDGNVDDGFEDCDDGDNLGVYDSCNPDCTVGPRCGDGTRQPDLGEDCDAGSDNGAPGSACSATCELIVQ